MVNTIVTALHCRAWMRFACCRCVNPCRSIAVAMRAGHARGRVQPRWTAAGGRQYRCHLSVGNHRPGPPGTDCMSAVSPTALPLPRPRGRVQSRRAVPGSRRRCRHRRMGHRGPSEPSSDRPQKGLPEELLHNSGRVLVGVPRRRPVPGHRQLFPRCEPIRVVRLFTVVPGPRLPVRT